MSMSMNEIERALRELRLSGTCAYPRVGNPICISEPLIKAAKNVAVAITGNRLN